MQNPTTVQSKWKRFSHAPYASFCSLHREVRIGVLSVAMLGSVSLKAHTNPVVAATDADVKYAEAAADDEMTTIGLEDVTVLTSRVPLTQERAARLVTVLSAVDIAAAAVHSINDLLEYAVGVDVRQRGEFGVQTDISVRGGNHDQITLLLNGINISSPHTGHLSADFPVSMQDIERIEVLEGPAARVFGTSAFTGVINIVTKSATHSDKAVGGEVALTGGSYGYADANARIHAAKDLSRGALSSSLSGGYTRSDGATNNSAFESTHFFYQGQYSASDRFRLDAQAGYSYKPYEANTFYGATNDQQWESNERIMTALRAEILAGKVHITPSLYWNRWFDHYQWWKDVSPSGENFHKVDTWGGNVNAWMESKLGKTSLGIEARHEGIFSTNLGKSLDEPDWVKTEGHDANGEVSYKMHDCRTNVSAFLEHDILLDRWTISLGVLANMNTGLDSKWRLYPGIDVCYRPALGVSLFASWNMALRMPTFTDLYYSGKNIEGNSDLKPERTNDFSVGARLRKQGWKAEASVFYSHKSDMIDWVTFAAAHDDIFHSVNFKSDNLGFELAASFLPKEIWSSCPIRKVCVQYAYIDEESEYRESILVSKYAMDYLRHKVVVQMESNLWKKLNASVNWRWQDRVGAGNDPYALLDARLSWDATRWSLFAECSNILDKTYYDYVSIPQPGRWGKVGLNIRF